MNTVLVIAGRSGETLDDDTFELIGAARTLGEVRVAAAVLGADTSAPAAELARRCDEVFAYDDQRLDPFDGDFHAEVLQALVAREKPWVTLIAHSNLGMDLAPALAVRAGTPLVGDCLSVNAGPDGFKAVRALHGGKLRARVAVAASDSGLMATIRPGAFTAPDEQPEAGGTVRQESIPEGCVPRRRHRETVVPDAGAVDIAQAERLVAVGRGIEDEENLDIVRSLADAMGAELCCTRPVVDKKWLDKSRQVGTSGRTVKPRVYLAVGVSGSFQHLGGIKGGPFLAAVNKDPAAPIFDVADVGVVGDLFDLVPLLEETIRKRKD